MKKIFSIILATLIIFSIIPTFAVNVLAETSTTDTTVGGFLDRVKSDFDLVFYDEFEGDTLDTTKWQYDGDATFRNSEAQIYANGPED